MANILTAVVAVIAAVRCVTATPVPGQLQQRQSANESVRVDLGYSIYEGYYNATAKLNEFKGIRFAAPPTGDLRWQPPQEPESQPGVVHSATTYASQCPQSPSSNDTSFPYLVSNISNEDCLFLNIWSPPDAKDLPVFFYIHGGGYGAGNGRQEMGPLLNSNGNNFVAVAIQYRLGAFGFLSSSEVAHFGTANAGLLDQHFALQWAQKYIHLFGGDPKRVTIAGQSAGGGSVMTQTMAYGGTLGDSLFSNAWAISPYLPQQHYYNDWISEQSYYAFATQAGCGATTAGLGSQKIFKCLVNADTLTLQRASSNVSASGVYGTWGFLPVTDGQFLRDIPSHQLGEKRVNGKRLLTGNNANEGYFFTIQNITTEDDLIDWLKLSYPTFNDEEIDSILQAYPAPDTPVNPNQPKYATNGISGPTALTEGSLGTGQQQRADDIQAESVFICASYWLAEAFNGQGREGYKYQYSVPPATHSEETVALFGNPDITDGPDFVKAYQIMAGNFVTKDNPSISNAIADGASSDSTAPNPTSHWPLFGDGKDLHMINFNQTGGHVIVAPPFNNSESVGPGLVNHFTEVDGYTWEGGRGARCDFWRRVGPIVPE